MSGRYCACLAVLVACSLYAQAARAQEFRIYTRIYDEHPSRPGDTIETGAKPLLIGRSLSLFHAGKVYDYIDTIGEMTIFEPAHERFIVINNARMISTVLTFSEIDNVLHRAQQQAENFVQKAEREKDPEHRKLIGPIRTQLQPDFRQSFAADSLRLKLTGKHLAYDVLCAASRTPEITHAYVRYADWTARLNYLLHSKTLLPGPRLALNAALQQRQVLPVEVVLQADMGSGLRLRAVHQYQWKLDTGDRRLIHHWETLLNSKDMQQVTFEEFQRTLLPQQSRR